MAIQTINIGTTANDGTGDDPRTAGDKINDNFTNSTHAASRDVGTASGNVMEIGALGYGSYGEVRSRPSSIDSITQSGDYITNPSTIGNPDAINQYIVSHKSWDGRVDISAQRAVGIIQKRDFFRVENSGIYSSWIEQLTTSNTTVDGSGFIKEASPIVKLYSDKIELNDYKELESCEFERVGTGHYIIKGAPLLSRDGWYIETLKDRNNNIYFTLDYEELEDGLHIKTYEPDYSTGRATNGAPVDINEGRFVTLRFEEDKTEE